MGVSSRRKAEEYIQQGRVKVNGHPAVIGMKVNPAKDIITLDDERITVFEEGRKVYYAMYKPRGYVTTLSDELDRKTVADLTKDIPVRVYPVGRLDKLSEGLLLLTNDGEFANMMMHPSHQVSKVYRVTVAEAVKEEQLVSLAEGVEIDGKRTLPANVKVITKEEGRTVMEMVIREGRNRQIRKMCEAVGLTVKRLRRTMIGPVKLSMLKPGEFRELTKGEISALKTMATKNLVRDEQQKKRESRPKRDYKPKTAGNRPPRNNKGDSYGNSKGNPKRY